MKYTAAELEAAFAGQLRALSHAMEQLDAEFMLIGGLAVGVWSEPRATKDMDFAVSVAADATDVAEQLQQAGLELARGDLAAAIADGTSVRLRAAGEPQGPVVVDLLFAGTAFEREALSRRTTTNLFGVEVPIATPEDLLIYKVIAGRPQDLADATRIVALHRDDLDMQRTRHWCTAFGVEETLLSLLGSRCSG